VRYHEGVPSRGRFVTPTGPLDPRLNFEGGNHAGALKEVAVDFEKVKANAADQGLELREIAMMYEGLTEDEVETLENPGLEGHRLEARAYPFRMTPWHR
jgi:hypothetical protein